ncbi:helix-turn-helix domain-containing protein [Gordonia sp. (in: high G+C Gram-positive bacteria)]|uniref:helix-turn-helix domain-containing protein n=1 Tax=unclassified Gordonia (in: high G+C Gram-positive bacteria) TaxID=2657482 RepID=UPI00260B92DC|nr:helix-turn-helix domain-containing protein [Gordonia sp. (in: high G+C Gram-positive bacteria)]
MTSAPILEPALAAGDDPRAYAAVLHAVYDASMAGEKPPARPRSVIGESWDRVRQAGVRPDSDGEPPLDTSDLQERRSASGLSELLDPLMHHLDTLIVDGENILVVADATGRVLWRNGVNRVLHRADRLGFTEGASWAERSVGTNAIGTALASGRAVQVFSAEHFVRSHHEWTCAGAPIHDPRTGAVLGVVDVSGPAATIHPTTLALVDTVARLAQSQLREAHRARLDELRAVAAPILARSSGPAFAVDSFGWVAALDGVDPRPRLPFPRAVSAGRHYLHGIGDCDLEPMPGGWLVRVAATDTAPGRIHVELLSGDEPLVRVTGAGGTWVHRPSPRHAQLLRLLAAHPGGLSAAQLAEQLFGNPGQRIAARSEMSRLRKHLGGVLASNPYRFAPEVIVSVAAPSRM